MRSWEDAMAMSWSNLWVIFTPHGCRVCGPVKFTGLLVVQWNSRVCLTFGWVRPFKFPRKPRISSRVHYFFGWVCLFKILRKLRRSPSFEKIWASPSFEIPRNRIKIQVLRFFGWTRPIKIAGNCRKIQISKPVHRGKPAEKSKCQNLFLVPCQKFPNWWTLTSSSRSSHICLQVTKDVWSPRLTVCCHSVGLSAKNEQELRLGMESMCK